MTSIITEFISEIYAILLIGVFLVLNFFKKIKSVKYNILLIDILNEIIFPKKILLEYKKDLVSLDIFQHKLDLNDWNISNHIIPIESWLYDKNILDFGCGTGRKALEMANQLFDECQRRYGGGSAD